MTSSSANTSVARLAILDYGLFQVHENGRIIGIPGFLVQTKDGRNILIDTGFPPKYAEDPGRATVEDGLDEFGRVLHLTAANLPAGQLALLGLTPADIDVVVLTHSDVDHVGGLADFPRATIIVHEAERALERPRYFGEHQPLAWPDRPYRLVTGDEELCPGLELLATPGHSPGHLSLLVRLPETGAVLLTADAISRPSELVEGFGGAWDEALARASAERLIGMAAREQMIIVYGHDPESWPELRKAPHWYE